MSSASRDATPELQEEFQQPQEQLYEWCIVRSRCATCRIEYGQLQVAHNAWRVLQQKGINRLIVESHFLLKVAQQQDSEDSALLNNSQKCRQFAAVSRSEVLLKNTATKYGITVYSVDAINITRICSFCNTLNASTANGMFECSNCAAVHLQDENSSINLVRFGTDSELAEMALRARGAAQPTQPARNSSKQQNAERFAQSVSR